MDELFDFFMEDFNKVFYDMSKQCGDEYYNDVVEKI